MTKSRYPLCLHPAYLNSFKERGENQMSDDWKKEWQSMIDSIGKDFSNGEERWGADAVDDQAL